MSQPRGFAHEGSYETRLETRRAGQESNEMYRKKSRQRTTRRIFVLRTFIVKCQLYRGKDKFPRTKEMTPTEMGKANRDFVKSNNASHDIDLCQYISVEYFNQTST